MVSMESEIRIAEEVQRLHRGGCNYAEIMRTIKRDYGISLGVHDINKYLGTGTKPAYQPLTTQPPVEHTPGEKQNPKKKSGISFRLIGIGVLTGALLVGGIVYTLNRNGEHKQPKQEQATTRQLTPEEQFSRYILVRTNEGYVIDFNQDRKPDGIAKHSVLKAAGSVLEIDKNINVESLLRSLYEIRADDIIVKSPDQIIAVTGKPSQFTVYRIDSSRLTVNADVNDAWQQINRQILGSLASNASLEQKRQTVEQALRSNPEAASLTLNVLGGADFGKYLQQQEAGLAITNYYSELARGNFSAAVGNLATGNVSGVIGNLFAAWFTEQAAKATIQGLEGSKSSEGSSESCPGIPGRGFYIITDPKAGVSYHFTDCAEAQQKLREIQSK